MMQAGSYRDGSLGEDPAEEVSLETAASLLLDPVLDETIALLQPVATRSLSLPPPALVAASTAAALAKAARASADLNQKLQLALAASYSAAFFGLPRNRILFTVDQIFDMFAMTAYQRRDMHQRAASLLDQYVASLKKGNAAMSGVYRDGVLGTVMRQSGAFQDGSLGRQNGAFQDGSLGRQNGAFQDGSLGRAGFNRRVARPQLRGLGCGCSGVGADVTVVPDTPFYKKPLVIGGAAVALGVVLYAVTHK